MSTQRRSRYNTRYRWDLNPRQRQVLDLIALGRTNGEIGATLGLTLDGAKYHVSEILTKLDVSSRREAAEYWRSYNSIGERLRRAANTGAPAGLLAGTLIVAIVLAVIALGLDQPSSPGGARMSVAAAEQDRPLRDGDGTLGGPDRSGSDVILAGAAIERFHSGALVSKATYTVTGDTLVVLEASDSPYAAGPFGCRTPGVYRWDEAAGRLTLRVVSDDPRFCPSRIQDLTAQAVAIP